VERGWGVKSLEGAKHCSVLSVLTYINIRKYFVAVTITSYVGVQYRSAISGRGEGSHIMGVQESHIWERGGFPRYGSTGVPYLRDGRFPTIWEYRSPISERGEVSHDMGVQESHIWERGGFPRYGSTGVPYLGEGEVSHDMGVQESHIWERGGFPRYGSTGVPYLGEGKVSHDMGVQECHI
jgi:hypothetical protein